MNKIRSSRDGERGGAAAKLLVVVVILGIIGHGLINFIPVAYNGENFKQEMQTAVVQAMVMPSNVGNPVDVTKKKIQGIALKNQVPADAIIDVKLQKNVLSVHVTYEQKVPIVPFGIYDYTYRFDNVATPTGFLAGD